MKSLKPTIINRDDHCVSRKNITTATLKVLYRLHEKGFTAYLAGGAVRDLLLKRVPKDFDVVTNATPEEIKNIFRNSRIVGRRFRLAHILFRGEIIETSTFRAPIPEKDTDKEESDIITDKEGLVVRDNLFGSPKEDALRRDFTINALFYDPKDFSIIDYANGMDDLNNKVIRVIGNPEKRFIEDPVRMIRAIRFASSLKFKINKDDFISIKKNSHLLQQASSSRMYDEIQKLFLGGSAKSMYLLLEEANLFQYMFIDFREWIEKEYKRKDWLFKTLEQLDRWRNANLTINPALLMALLFGEYHKFFIENTRNKGHQATRDIIYGHLSSLSLQIRIPKTIIYQVTDIMIDQERFNKMNRHQSNRFIQSERFLDSFLFFKVWSKFNNENLDKIDYWSNKQRSIKKPAYRNKQKTRKYKK